MPIFIRYNKNRLLLYSFLAIVAFYYIPRVFNLLTFEKTKGTYLKEYINGIIIDDNTGSLPLDAFEAPVVHFKANDMDYYFTCDHFILEHINRISAPVIYKRSDPSIAYVNTFDAYWGTPLVIIFPFMVAMAVLILGFGMKLSSLKGKRIEDPDVVIELDGKI